MVFSYVVAASILVFASSYFLAFKEAIALLMFGFTSFCASTTPGTTRNNTITIFFIRNYLSIVFLIVLSLVRLNFVRLRFVVLNFIQLLNFLNRRDAVIVI